jgi:DNA-binding NtrC family response regulator
MPHEKAQQRILVVDDEHMIADSLALILMKNGFLADVAYSGEMAVEIAADVRPDVLVSDVVMGNMSGVEAAIQISGTAPQCRVILISGQQIGETLIEQARAYGHIFEFLQKPVHPTVILERLQALCPQAS